MCIAAESFSSVIVRDTAVLSAAPDGSDENVTAIIASISILVILIVNCKPYIGLLGGMPTAALEKLTKALPIPQVTPIATSRSPNTSPMLFCRPAEVVGPDLVGAGW